MADRQIDRWIDRQIDEQASGQLVAQLVCSLVNMTIPRINHRQDQDRHKSLVWQHGSSQILVYGIGCFPHQSYKQLVSQIGSWLVPSLISSIRLDRYIVTQIRLASQQQLVSQIVRQLYSWLVGYFVTYGQLPDLKRTSSPQWAQRFPTPEAPKAVPPPPPLPCGSSESCRRRGRRPSPRPSPVAVWPGNGSSLEMRKPQEHRQTLGNDGKTMGKGWEHDFLSTNDGDLTIKRDQTWQFHKAH